MAVLVYTPGLWVSDSTKLVIFVVALAALFLVMRMFSRRAESRNDFTTPLMLPEQSDESAEGSGAAQVHPRMRFEEIELRSYYLHQFDIFSGPPDPFEFVDELTAEVEHLQNGGRSTWTFTIGTPSGFAQLLEGKGWESFYSPQIFVVRKYEIEMVRQMIVDHISSVLSGSPDQSESSPSN